MPQEAEWRIYMIKEAISILVQGRDLSQEIMEQVMEEIMTGEATDSQKAAFLTALSIKGDRRNYSSSKGYVFKMHTI